MSVIDALKTIESVIHLWERGSLFLWALTCSTLMGFFGLWIGAQLQVGALATQFPNYGHWFIGAALLLTPIACFKTYQERTTRTVSFTPTHSQSFWHSTTNNPTQISIHFTAANLTKMPIRLADVRLTKPKPSRRPLNSYVLTEDPLSREYSSKHNIPSQKIRDVSVMFMLEETLAVAGPLTVKLVIYDQFGHRHPVTVRELRHG